MNINRPDQITGKLLAQNVLFITLFSLFIAFGLTLVVLWAFVGMTKLDSMPKHEARTLLAWIYGLSWILSAVVLSWHRYVQLSNYQAHTHESATIDKPLGARSRKVPAWRRKGFFNRTYFLTDGSNTLYTLEREGEGAVMYNESIRLRIDAEQVVTDEATGHRLAMADLKLNRLVSTPTRADNVICGSIRCNDGLTYSVAFTAGIAKLKAQNAARFISIQGSTMAIDTNVSLLDKNVAALCLILSSFLVFGELPQCS